MTSDDHSQNSGVTENEGNSKDESAPSTKPKTINLSVLENGNIGSTVSDFIQNVDPEENPESSNENKEVRVIHPQQFKAFQSSEDLLLASNPQNLNSMENQNSLVIIPGCTKMSNNTFRDFLLTNFPSDVPIQNDQKSLLWAARVLTREQCRSLGAFVDKSTQSKVRPPSTSEETSPSDVFSRHAITTTSQQTQISPSIIPPHPVQGDPPLQGAPPTYSAVMRVGPSAPRRIFGRRVGSQLEPSPPFISRTPPPTYAEAQGRYFRPLVSVDSELLWGPDPMPATCPRCGAFVITTITSERSNLTHFAALSLCLCGCWPCCLLPYCMNSCKNTYHYCPNCNTFLGVYRPW